MKSTVRASTLLLPFLARHAGAVQYYVDCDGGNDALDGLSPSTAWRYPPGSTHASGIASSAVPQPGDEIRIRGLCATSVDLSSAGTSEHPIRWIGNWPGDDDSSRAVLWGGSALSSVPASESGVSEIANHGQLEHLVVSEVLPSSLLSTDDDINVFQGPPASSDAQRLQLAHWPNSQPNPYKDDDLAHYVPAPPAQVTETSLQDSRLGVWSSAALERAHLLIWVYGNRVERRPVSFYNESSNTIHWDEPILPYQDRDSLYSLQGAVEFISEPGEYAVLDRKVVAYPYEGSEQQMSISVRTRGIDLKGREHRSIESLQIVQYSGSEAFEGTAIYNGYRNDKTPGIHLRALTIFHNYKRRGDTVRLNTLFEPILEDLTISQNTNQRAVAVISSERGVISANAIRDGSLSCFGCDHFVIADNSVGGDLPIHANGITVYAESHGTIVARNRVEPTSPSIAMTVKQSGGVRAFGNVLSTAGDVAFALWSHGTDPTHSFVFVNNYLSGRMVMSETLASCTIVNNALAGLDLTAEAYRGDGTIHHNLHHELQWNQANEYGWTPFPNETVATDLPISAIFDVDYSPAAGSPLIDAGDSDLAALASGLDQGKYAPTAESMLDYLRIDADGNARDADGGGTDIGALEYTGPAPSPATSPPTRAPTSTPTTSSPTTPNEPVGDPSLIVRYPLVSDDLADSSGRSQPAAWWRSAVSVGGCDGTTICGPKNAICKCYPEPDLSDPSYHSQPDFSSSGQQALTLDGSDYALVPEDVRLQIVTLGQVTAGVWAKPTASGYLFYQHKGISIRLDSNYVYCNVATTDNGYPNDHYRDVKAWHGGAPFLGDAWHHFAVTYDGSSVRCYVDGVVVGSKPSTGTIPQGYPSWSLGLGINAMKILWGPNKALPVKGSLKDFRVYSRGLSDEKVSAWGTADAVA